MEFMLLLMKQNLNINLLKLFWCWQFFSENIIGIVLFRYESEYFNANKPTLSLITTASYLKQYFFMSLWCLIHISYIVPAFVAKASAGMPDNEHIYMYISMFIHTCVIISKAAGIHAIIYNKHAFSYFIKIFENMKGYTFVPSGAHFPGDFAPTTALWMKRASCHMNYFVANLFKWKITETHQNCDFWSHNCR